MIPPNLTDYLQTQEPGRLPDTADLERHLAGCWFAFEGHNCEWMTPKKLLGRIEQVEWSPPVLSFVIERHGGTCLGSTRADLHRWTVSLTDETASCEKVGHRQLRPIAPRLLLQPLAEEIAGKIAQGQGDERLVWQAGGRVQVVLSSIVPPGSGFKQTVDGRRKRFMQALVPLMEKSGWHHAGRSVFTKDGPDADDTPQHSAVL